MARTCSKCREDKEESHFYVARFNTCKKCDDKNNRKWFIKNQDRRWDYHLRKEFGFGAAAYYGLLSIQGGVCLICGTDKPGGRGNKFNVDHDHATGRIRGLLCRFCNHFLGFARDNIQSLTKAIEYLKGEALPMYQKVVLAGRLGQDPTVKYTQSGTAVANFSLAVDERFKGKDGSWQERTEWVPIVVWDKQAENVGQYLKKGSAALIEGKLQTRSWGDKSSGEKKYKTEVVASLVKFLDKPETATPSAVDDPGDIPF